MTRVQLERFALHFYKCPDVLKVTKPDFATKSQYFWVICAFTLVHFIVKDPVHHRSKVDNSAGLKKWTGAKLMAIYVICQ